MSEAECELGVYLIRKYCDIRRAQDLGDALKVLTRHDRAGRIVGVRQHKQLCPWRDSRRELFRRELEFILSRRINDDRHAACHSHKRLVADKARLGIYHLIPRRYQRAYSHIYRFTAAYCDDDLFFGVIYKTETARKIRRYLAAQIKRARI